MAFALVVNLNSRNMPRSEYVLCCGYIAGVDWPIGLFTSDFFILCTFYSVPEDEMGSCKIETSSSHERKLCPNRHTWSPFTNANIGSVHCS